MNPIATAAYGMFAASQRFDASAQRVAGMGAADSDIDLGQEATTQVEAKTAFTANVAVLKTADKMQQSLLDILA
jgi:flagellar basal body rod protein FlgC